VFGLGFGFEMEFRPTLIALLDALLALASFLTTTGFEVAALLLIISPFPVAGASASAGAASGTNLSTGLGCLEECLDPADLGVCSGLDEEVVVESLLLPPPASPFSPLSSTAALVWSVGDRPSSSLWSESGGETREFVEIWDEEVPRAAVGAG
jgi:hypothetical protein